MAVKEKVGTVVSNKMDKTCIVAVNDRIIHKKYKKVITRTKRYAVHDAELIRLLAIKYLFVRLVR